MKKLIYTLAAATAIFGCVRAGLDTDIDACTQGCARECAGCPKKGYCKQDSKFTNCKFNCCQQACKNLKTSLVKAGVTPKCKDTWKVKEGYTVDGDGIIRNTAGKTLDGAATPETPPTAPTVVATPKIIKEVTTKEAAAVTVLDQPILTTPITAAAPTKAPTVAVTSETPKTTTGTATGGSKTKKKK